MGKHEKTQHIEDLVPSCRILEAVGWFVLSFAAVIAVSVGPGWLVPFVVVAYAAAVI